VGTGPRIALQVATIDYISIGNTRIYVSGRHTTTHIGENMRNFTFLALVSALVFVGCEDKKETTEDPTGGAAGATPSASAGQAGVAGSAAPSASAGAAGSAAPTGSAGNPDGGDASQ
jgi:hypothetical protein